MIEFRPLQPAEMARRHAAKGTRPAGSKAPKAEIRPPVRNVEPILSIGDTEYFHFRGRAFGVPPLPWRAGQRIAELQARALGAIERLSVKPTDERTRADYYVALAQVPPLLWANCRPTGKWRRFLANRFFRFIRFSRNPFDTASDRELLELLDFFSSRRMKSGVQSRPMVARQAQQT